MIEFKVVTGIDFVNRTYTEQTLRVTLGSTVDDNMTTIIGTRIEVVAERLINPMFEPEEEED